MKEDGPTQVKYCLYARKSSESDERQTMSIDSQIKEMMEAAGLNEIKFSENTPFWCAVGVKL